MMWLVIGYLIVVIVTLSLCKAASLDREYREEEYNENNK